MAVEYKDYYKILGVEKTADEKAIKSAYRKMTRKYHPDVNPGDKTAEATFKEINEAYGVLSDPEKRKQYDQLGRGYFTQSGDPGAGYGRYSSGTGSGSSYSTSTMSPEELDELFDFFRNGNAAGGSRTSTGRGGYAGYGAGFGTGSFQQRGEDFEQPVDVTLEEAFSGSQRMMELTISELCKTCRGEGVIRNVVKGRTEVKNCTTCYGRGETQRNRKLEIKIPAGIQSGGKIKLAGQGGVGRSGGINGDLYLVVNILPHDRFERDGDNLRVNVPVDLYTALLGGEVVLPTLKGTKIALKINAGSQNGMVIRMPGQGMPLINSDRRGFLLAKVDVLLPLELDEYEQQQFAELREHYDEQQQLKRIEAGN